MSHQITGGLRRNHGPRRRSPVRLGDSGLGRGRSRRTVYGDGRASRRRHKVLRDGGKGGGITTTCWLRHHKRDSMDGESARRRRHQAGRSGDAGGNTEVMAGSAAHDSGCHPRSERPRGDLTRPRHRRAHPFHVRSIHERLRAASRRSSRRDRTATDTNGTPARPGRGTRIELQATDGCDEFRFPRKATHRGRKA